MCLVIGALTDLAVHNGERWDVVSYQQGCTVYCRASTEFVPPYYSQAGCQHALDYGSGR